MKRIPCITDKDKHVGFKSIEEEYEKSKFYTHDKANLNSQNKLPKEWKSQIVDLKTGLNKMLNKIKEGN